MCLFWNAFAARGVGGSVLLTDVWSNLVWVTKSVNSGFAKPWTGVWDSVVVRAVEGAQWEAPTELEAHIATLIFYFPPGTSFQQ